MHQNLRAVNPTVETILGVPRNCHQHRRQVVVVVVVVVESQRAVLAASMPPHQ
jgi:hypothetical protein